MAPEVTPRNITHRQLTEHKSEEFERQSRYHSKCPTRGISELKYLPAPPKKKQQKTKNQQQQKPQLDIQPNCLCSTINVHLFISLTSVIFTLTEFVVTFLTIRFAGVFLLLLLLLLIARVSSSLRRMRQELHQHAVIVVVCLRVIRRRRHLQRKVTNVPSDNPSLLHT